jgi:hypothetical protein
MSGGGWTFEAWVWFNPWTRWLSERDTEEAYCRWMLS